MQSKAQKAKSKPETGNYVRWNDYRDGQGNNVCSGDASVHELQAGKLVKAAPKHKS